MGEIWIPVAGYEGVYEVSNYGRIRSVNHFTQTKCGSAKMSPGRILSQNRASDYCTVTLCKDGIRNTRAVHRIVATAFIDNPNGLPCVNHKDENKRNNASSNLEWCDRSYNVNYGTALERAKPKMAYAKKKPVAQYLHGELIATYKSLNDASSISGVDAGHIGHCCNGKRKTAGGYQWAFIEGGMTYRR